MLTSLVSNTAAMFVTSPTRTPLNMTGEPTDSPAIDPEKNITQVGPLWRNLPAPAAERPRAASARAPTTNPPTSVLLVRLATACLLAPGQERADAGVRRFRQELLGVPRGGDRLALGVEEDRVVRDGEDARELVRHHHHGRAEAVAE